MDNFFAIRADMVKELESRVYRLIEEEQKKQRSDDWTTRITSGHDGSSAHLGGKRTDDLKPRKNWTGDA